MAGQLLNSLSRREQAREWLSAGVEVAKTQGNSQALGELQGELALATQGG
jgi:hypothetical protein